jgi:hypothetical protein
MREKSARGLSRNQRPPAFELLGITFVLISLRHSRETVNALIRRRQRGINFNDLPLWQRRGAGLYWQRYQKTGTNPLTQEVVSTTRRQLTKHRLRVLFQACLEARQPFVLDNTNDARRVRRSGADDD